MIYTEDFTIPRHTFDLFEAILRGNRPWEDGVDGAISCGQNVITAFSISFGDGFGVDFNITKCERDKPYLDVILFDEGCEMYTWEIRESLLGCWEAVFGGDIQKAFRVETFI